jgi:hypothetical protein
MTETPVDTIRQLLESSMGETDDTEVRFKLRTALQLLDAVDRHQEMTSEALEAVEIEASVRENLRELGYMD